MGEISEQRMTRPKSEYTPPPFDGDHACAMRAVGKGYDRGWRLTCTCGINVVYPTRSRCQVMGDEHLGLAQTVPPLDPNDPQAWKLDPALNPRHWRNCVARQKENRLTGKTGQGWAYGLDPATHGEPYSVT